MKEREIIILFGPPGAGKGTRGIILSNEIGYHLISTGEILRQSKDEKVKDIMDNGNLVPDEIVMNVLKHRISKSDCQEGVILDGLPRTIEQCHLLDDIIDEIGGKITYFINHQISEDEIYKRIYNRRQCGKCGNIFTSEYKICPLCGVPLYCRSDDNPKTVAKRLEEFYKERDAIVAYYQAKGVVYALDATNNSEKILEFFK